MGDTLFSGAPSNPPSGEPHVPRDFNILAITERINESRASFFVVESTMYIAHTDKNCKIRVTHRSEEEKS